MVFESQISDPGYVKKELIWDLGFVCLEEDQFCLQGYVQWTDLPMFSVYTRNGQNGNQPVHQMRITGFTLVQSKTKLLDCFLSL